MGNHISRRACRSAFIVGVVAVAVVVTSCAAPPTSAPPGACTPSVRPPAPSRAIVDDCSGLVDVADLAPAPPPPLCVADGAVFGPFCPAGGTGPGGTASTQGALEAWRGCTAIDGDLVVGGAVCSLDPLESLTTVNGSLTLGGGEDASDQFVVVDLAGLEGLRTVTGTLTISGLPALASLSGLSSLQHVGVDLELRQLPALQHLRGPDSLIDVGGDVDVGFNDNLVVVDGFDGLGSIGGDGDIRDFSGVRFGHDGSLVCVGGFGALTSVGEIELEDGPVKAVPGLSTALIAAAPTLKLIDVADFDVLTLPAVTALAGLDLVRPPPFTDLRAFAGLTTLGSLRVFDSKLQALGGLDDLVTLGVLELRDNTDLRDVGALDGVTALGALTLTRPQTYDLVCALPASPTIDVVTIAQTDLRVIPWPRSLERIGALTISANDDLDDLGDTDLVLGAAVISDNASLSNDDAIAFFDEQTVEGVAKYGNNGGQLVDPCPWFDDGVCDFFCVADSAADCPPIED